MNTNSKHMPANERRAVTVEAVIKLASEQNPGDITTAAIAKHMGVTQGALFRHFPSKEAIWQSVMEWVDDALLSRIDQAAATAITPMDKLESIFLAHIKFVSLHPGVPRILFSELQRSESTIPKQTVLALLKKYADRLQLIIDQGKTAGHIDPEIETASAINLFLGMIQGLVMQSLLAGTTRSMQRKSHDVFAIYLRGIEKDHENT